MNQKYRKLRTNISYVAIGVFASKLLSILFVPLYTSVLSTEQYGTADLIFVTVHLLYPIFTFVIYEATLRMLLDNDENYNSIVQSNFIVNLFSALLFTSISLLIFFICRNIAVIMFLIYYLASIMQINIMYTARGLNKLDAYAVGSILNASLIIIFNILFLLVFRLGIIGYVLAYSFALIISSIAVFFQAGIYTYLSPKTLFKIDKKRIRSMLKYSAPMIPNSISWWTSNSSDRYILTYYHGTSENGLYSVAGKIPSFISIISTIFATAWQVSAVEDFGSDESKKFYSDIYFRYCSCSIITVSLVILCIRILAKILFKAGFYNAWVFSTFLVSASMFYGFSTFIGTIFSGAKQTKPLFYSTLVGSIFNVILNLLLIPIYGAIGAAIATLVSYLLVLLMRIVMSRQILRFNIDFKNNISCYLLIAIQSLVTILNFKFWFIISLMCFFLILFLRRSFILLTLSDSKRLIYRNFKEI